MYVKLIAFTPEPERVIAAAARCCYSNKEPDKLFDDIGKEEAENFIEKLMSSGHHSPLEHVSFTFVVSGISRACLAQLTRHRIASFSVRSQRYVTMDEDTSHWYNPFEGYTGQTTCESNELLQAAYLDSFEKYKRLLENGMNKEDARMVLPNGATTSLVLTMNARELLHFFSIRCCVRAQAEIRQLASEMVKAVQEVAPILFKKAGPTCFQLDYCPEGKMSCGKAPTLNELLKRGDNT